MFKKEPKDTEKEYLDLVLENATKIETCCDCDIYAEIIQTVNYKYSIQLYKKNICDSHKLLLKQRYMDKVGKDIGH